MNILDLIITDKKIEVNQRKSLFRQPIGNPLLFLREKQNHWQNR